MKKFYVTTPLYYVNDVPHIGHAYTTIAADVLARWKRLRGEDVFFLTGTDEHGAKIAQAAETAGVTPAAFVENVAGSFRSLWQRLLITNDDFIRTAEERHKKVVQEVFEKLKASGDIYKGTYEDWYCIHDEAYFSDGEVVDAKCPTCGRPIQKLKEESYFFKLSKYEQPLLDHFAKHPEFLSPPHRANEIINFVKSGLRDLSVSRTRVKWGVQIPSDLSHTVYVWFDALLNYISAVKTDPNIWPADVHLVGKEIFRFHTVIWPAMLLALKLPLPKKVYAHGWWTVEGTKMSKSLGNVVDPHKMADIYGVDAFRYFLFREVPFGADGDFSEKALLNRFNSELANNLGNLLQRTTTILVKNMEGKITNISEKSELMSDAGAFFADLDKKYADLALGDVLETVYALMIKTNKYIDEKAPWKLGPERAAEISSIIIQCLYVVKALAIALYPFMPTKAEEIWKRIGEKGPISCPPTLKDLSFAAGQTVAKGDPLFMRIGTKK